MSTRQTIESSDALITLDLRNLRAADMKLGKDIRGLGEVTVEQRRDEAGSYSLVSLVPEPSAPKWFGTFVTLLLIPCGYVIREDIFNLFTGVKTEVISDRVG